MTANWDWLLALLRAQEPILSFLTTLLWGLYVLYTIKTFREIHRQTELQSAAFLVVSVSNEEQADRSELSQAADARRVFRRSRRISQQEIPSKIQTLQNKWRDILKGNIPDIELTDRPVLLGLKNHGKSDVVSWQLDFTLLIEPSKYLEYTRNTLGESITWTIAGNEVISIDGTIDVLVLNVGSFPEAKLSWTLSYKDIRDIKYERFGGARDTEFINPLADPAQQVTLPARKE
jgi:hypothetical protein